MDELLVNADRTRPALEHGRRLPWLPSPEQGIERRLLERVGGEVALATSIVRYQADSRFPEHVHELGEEFFVLSGTFCDEHGSYPTGTYVRNPPGSRHAPFSDSGCVIFVKLRQMHPDDGQFVRRSFQGLDWVAQGNAGHHRATLFAGNRVTVSLERLNPGATRPATTIRGGEEIFVIEGRFAPVEAAPELVLDEWSWFRRPGTRGTALTSLEGALVWCKRGHL